jgi:Uma2 family endonuclease
MPEVVLCDVEHEPVHPRDVIVEVVHPTLRFCEWRERYLAHSASGVAEYYLIHPGPPLDVEVWCRDGDQLAPVRKKHGWISPRLGLRFELIDEELRVFDHGGVRIGSAPDLLACFRELGVDPDAV